MPSRGWSTIGICSVVVDSVASRRRESEMYNTRNDFWHCRKTRSAGLSERLAAEHGRRGVAAPGSALRRRHSTPSRHRLTVVSSVRRVADASATLRRRGLKCFRLVEGSTGKFSAKAFGFLGRLPGGACRKLSDTACHGTSRHA